MTCFGTLRACAVMTASAEAHTMAAELDTPAPAAQRAQRRGCCPVTPECCWRGRAPPQPHPLGELDAVHAHDRQGRCTHDGC